MSKPLHEASGRYDRLNKPFMCSKYPITLRAAHCIVRTEFTP